MSVANLRLALFLRVSAAILLLALGAMVMPHGWMDVIHGWLGLGTLAEQPMVAYLARSASAMYASLGALYLYLSYDLRRYLELLRFLARLKLAFGVAMFVLDVVVGMPLLWVAVEGPFILGWSLALLWLVRSAEAALSESAV